MHVSSLIPLRRVQWRRTLNHVWKRSDAARTNCVSIGRKHNHLARPHRLYSSIPIGEIIDNSSIPGVEEPDIVCLEKMRHHLDLLDQYASDPASLTLPDLIVESKNSIGIHHWNGGDLDRAQKCFEEQLTFLLKLHSDDGASSDPSCHPDIAATLHTLGNIHSRKHEDGSPSSSSSSSSLDEAMKWYTESLRMKESLFGSEGHPEIAKTLNGIGSVYSQSDDPKTALGHFKNAEEMLRTFYSRAESSDEEDQNYDAEYHPHILSIVENQARLHVVNRDWAGGEERYQEVLRIQRFWVEMGTTGDHSIISTLMNLGDCLYNLKREDDALDVLQEGIKLCRQHLRRDDDASDILAMKALLHHTLGLVHAKKRNWNMALAQYEAAQEIKIQILGRDDSTVADTLNCMGAVHAMKGDDLNALEVFKEALRIYKINIHGDPENDNIDNTLRNIALLRGSTFGKSP